MYCATRFCDDFPARHHHQHGDEAVQQDERHGDAVHAEVVVDVEAPESSGASSMELHRRRRCGRNRVHSGSVTRKPASAPTSASQRASRRVAVAADGEHQRRPQRSAPRWRG